MVGSVVQQQWRKKHIINIFPKLLVFEFSYYISYLQPCPIVADPITTPPIDNYTVNIIKSGNTYSTEDIDTSICYYTKEVNEDDTYNVEVFANNIIGNSNRRKVDFGEFIVL